jgi:hypothetical protein
MTRMFLVQNLEEEGSIRPLIATHWPAEGKPYSIKVDPQRALTVALHKGLPLVSIGTEVIPEDALPGEHLIETAKTAAQLEQRISGFEAENQQLRADKDRLAGEVERLKDAIASHDPLAGADESTLVIEHSTLTAAHNKAIDDLRAAEAQRDAANARVAELEEQLATATGATLSGAQPPAEPQAIALEDLTKAELLEHAKLIGGIDVDDGMRKADIIEAIRAAPGQS